MLNTLLQGCIFVKATKVLRMSQQKLIETIHNLMDHLTLFLRNIGTTVKNRNHVCLLVFHFIFYKLFEVNVPLHRFQYSSFSYSLSISKIGILLRYILSTFPNCCLYSILYLELTKIQFQYSFSLLRLRFDEKLMIPLYIPIPTTVLSHQFQFYTI